ncbi:potassium channel family protein [Microbacterium sp. CIAB417]|uniref:potassium channel family protein n=1 Tax=Microbacterium sp. CIAB417 TaxID=2860287 RepID=UPI001FAB8D58|nr:potassium channel family protein [Microbacterium sp. CIAB417]
MGGIRDRIAARRRARTELKNPAYEIFIGILSLLSIMNLVFVYALHGDTAMQVVLAVMNGVLSVIFLIDFVYRMATSTAPRRYFFRGFGWADLLASLPFPQLKVLRVFRLLRVLRLMRDLGPKRIATTLVQDRANSTLMTLLLLGILVLQFGSLSVLAVEEDADGANITTASDALWYTIVTIATVGYGDQYPVTQAGRLLGVLIIVVGVGIFGTFTGYLANLFLGPSGKTEAGPDRTEKTSDPADGANEDEAAGHAAAAGVAAGAASGAVAVGVSAGRRADAADADDRLRELLERAEQLTAELRRMVAERRGGPAEENPSAGEH